MLKQDSLLTWEKASYIFLVTTNAGFESDESRYLENIVYQRWALAGFFVAFSIMKNAIFIIFHQVNDFGKVILIGLAQNVD